jgi:hypothetical protein
VPEKPFPPAPPSACALWETPTTSIAALVAAAEAVVDSSAAASRTAMRGRAMAFFLISTPSTQHRLATLPVWQALMGQGKRTERSGKCVEMFDASHRLPAPPSDRCYATS